MYSAQNKGWSKVSDQMKTSHDQIKFPTVDYSHSEFYETAKRYFRSTSIRMFIF